MIRRPTASALSVIVTRLLCVFALGMLVSGCDRCGDWWWAPNQSQSCKGNAPR